MRKHPGPKGKGLGYLRSAYGLGEGRRKEPNPPFQQIDKDTVLQVLETKYAYEAVTCLQLIISFF
jgi:hypothetical protein